MERTLVRRVHADQGRGGPDFSVEPSAPGIINVGFPTPRAQRTPNLEESQLSRLRLHAWAANTDSNDIWLTGLILRVRSIGPSIWPALYEDILLALGRSYSERCLSFSSFRHPCPVSKRLSMTVPSPYCAFPWVQSRSHQQ